MTINAQVFQALLAMDAYNRGYLKDLEKHPFKDFKYDEGTKIALGKIIQQSNPDKQSPEVKASFSATAYEYGDKIIISYRGTDDKDLLTGDKLTGWTIGAGFYGSQAELAIKFYQSVAAGAGKKKIVLTGHSLGGGLAGLVGSLYHKEIAVFDNMAFEKAANNVTPWPLFSS